MSSRGKLTTGQSLYVTHRLQGDKPQVAYAKAFPGASKWALTSKPYVLERNKLVMAAMEAAVVGNRSKMSELLHKDVRKGVATAGRHVKEAIDAGLTRTEKRRILKRLAQNAKLDPVDRIRAIQVDNLMTGDNKPVRFEGEITLRGIFQALTTSTGLPASEEVIELDPNGPMAMPG